MKRNLLYLAGFLLAAATVFSGCNDDDPSYHDLVPNTQELIINLDETPEGIIQIVQGNGNYKITSSNEDVRQKPQPVLFFFGCNDRRCDFVVVAMKRK